MKNKKYYLILILNTVTILSSLRLLHANEPIVAKLETLRAKLEELKQSLIKLKSSLTRLNDELTKVDKLIAEMGIEDIATASATEISEALSNLDNEKQAELAKRSTAEKLDEDGTKEIKSTPSTLYSVLIELINQKNQSLQTIQERKEFFFSFLKKLNVKHQNILFVNHEKTITRPKGTKSIFSGYTSDFTELIKKFITINRKNIQTTTVYEMLNSLPEDYKKCLLNIPSSTSPKEDPQLSYSQIHEILRHYLCANARNYPTINEFHELLNNLSEKYQNLIIKKQEDLHSNPYDSILLDLLLSYILKHNIEAHKLPPFLNNLNEKYKNALIDNSVIFTLIEEIILKNNHISISSLLNELQLTYKETLILNKNATLEILQKNNISHKIIENLDDNYQELKEYAQNMQNQPS